MDETGRKGEEKGEGAKQEERRREKERVKELAEQGGLKEGRTLWCPLR